MSVPEPFFMLIVEDDPLVRADLADCLQEAGYQVIGEAGTKADALAQLRETEPDLVLLDIHLERGQEGIEIAREINAQYLIPFIYLTALIDEKTLSDVSDTLPAGFVVKPFDEGRLKAAIEIARRTYYAVLEPHWRRQEDLLPHLPEPLTQRETELLTLLCEGKTYRRMAEELFVSINTVKTHLKNLYLKLQVSNRAEAILKVKGWQGN